MTKDTDIALTAHTSRQKGAEPGTRGPHLNLFSGGTVAKKAAPVELTTTERAAKFAEVRKIKEDATRVLTDIVSHHERTGEPLRVDAYDIAKMAGVSFERAVVIRSELMKANAVRVFAGQWGNEGLLPGDAWDFQHGRRQ
ncbi:hypothetical protein [Methylorubrum sp. SB2]|uniref:hypothetical protein n=1 Tax=Methylorubrum subtropicum TaxID=3138812 RepID=UPI00313BF33F